VVGRAAGDDRGSAGSIYLACYFLGGIVSSIVLGHLFDHVGWAACVFGVAVMLGIAGLLTFRLGSIAEQERFADR
jgi:MFS family permease